ncbi:MAG: SAM-dependent methyltransferase, partial [Patescibacteria group bacterium]|nr:SAM-dependent methyltransferase [Patescibacteria group bacterium]
MSINNSKVKDFATEARTILLNDVERKLVNMHPENPDSLPTKMDQGVEVEDVSFKSGIKKRQRNKLIKKYNQLGKEEIVKRAAYIWFNRLIAIRFMEVNGFLETGVRVLSSLDPKKSEPQIVTKALSVNLPVDKDIVYRFLDESDTKSLFKYLFILQCNQLHKSLPFLFEKIDDYTQLLLPDNLLGSNSVIKKLVNDIPEDNFKEVEIIGWLYQYYVKERKDKLIKAKKKHKTEDIPPVTQLFTPHWIVKYMTQNSLGRYWIESHPEHKEELINSWDFFLENRDKKSKEKIKQL